MAQPLNEIQEEILTSIEQSADLPAAEILTENEQQNVSNITSESRVGVLRHLVFVFAVAAFTLQKLWDVFRSDIEERIAESRPFTERWYRQTALNYQHGYDLEENGSYPVPATIEEANLADASKVVKKAAVVQTVINGVGALRLKVATSPLPASPQGGGELEPLTAEQLQGFQEYIELMGAAGVYVVATTNEADMLKLHYKIYFNPLVLDNQGRRLDGTNDTPVQNAVKDYLKSSNINDFNGRLSLAKLTDVIQKVEGVEDPFLQLAASKYGGYTYESDATNVGTINNYRRPDSGYMKLDEAESTFEFIAAE